MKIRKRRAIAIFLSIGVLVAVPILLITISGLVEDEAQSDIAVVFGNKVHEDGTPSGRLRSRLDRAIELFRASRCRYIIVSGGVGVEGHDEAAVMKEYLVEKGLPEERIVVDSEGWTTWDSAINALPIAEQAGLSNPSVVAVSQYFHLARCRLSLRRAGFEEVSSSYARYLELRDAYSIVREIPAYLKYLIFRRRDALESAAN